MSPVLPFDIIFLIIHIVGENEDTNLFKELALVSHSFHQICSKHLFATVELHDANPRRNVASSKKGFVKLLNSRPGVVKYIRKLTYEMGFDDDDGLLSPILPNFLRTISGLNTLKISGKDSMSDWNELNCSVTSVFLHLMHLPTVNHIDLSLIENFPLSSFTPSVNLHRLDIFRVDPSDQIKEDGEPEDDGSLIFVQSGMMPKLREFHISDSGLMAKQLLLAQGQDGRPAFNFKDLIGLSVAFGLDPFLDEQIIRYGLQNAKLIEKLRLSVGRGHTLVDLDDVLSLRASTLKVLDLTVSLYDESISVLPGGIYEELEALAGRNILETLSLKVYLNARETETADFIGLIIQKVERVLVKPGWSALRQVSFEVFCYTLENRAKLSEALQSLPGNYIGHLSKLVSVAFNCLVRDGYII